MGIQQKFLILGFICLHVKIHIFEPFDLFHKIYLHGLHKVVGIAIHNLYLISVSKTF